MKGQLIVGSQAKKYERQHKSPCLDCPFARRSLAGWLGSTSPNMWLDIVHGEGRIECHTRIPHQCAGAAIFRSNVCKSPRDGSLLVLPSDTVKVFANNQEFRDHHQNGKGRSW